MVSLSRYKTKFVIKENDNLLEESKEIKKELIKQIEKTIKNLPLNKKLQASS